MPAELLCVRNSHLVYAHTDVFTETHRVSATLSDLVLPRCDSEWGGEYCDEPVVPLPSQLKDSFSRAPSLSHWHLLTGGKLSTVCGAVASGAALHFSGVSGDRVSGLLS